MEFVTLLVVITIIGALLGGKSFGDTVSKGCGCLFTAGLILTLAGVLLLMFIVFSDTPDHTIRRSPDDAANFIASENCTTYTRPDINSTTTGQVLAGQVIVVNNSSRFKYFYEIYTDDSGKTYVLKDCLEKR